MTTQPWGIYFNKETKQVSRIGMGVRPPTDSNWAKLTDDPNMGLFAIRELAQSQGLVANTDDIQWE